MCALFSYSCNCTYGVAQANAITRRLTERPRIPCFDPIDLTNFSPLLESRWVLIPKQHSDQKGAGLIPPETGRGPMLTNSIQVNPYPTAFPYGNGMVLHFYQQQESSTTKTVHKVINKGLKTYV